MAVKPGGEDRMSKLIILSSLILGLYGMVMWVIAFVLFANNGHIYEPVTWIAITALLKMDFKEIIPHGFNR